MKVDVNATGLTAEEVREAVENAKRWKRELTIGEWQEIRKDLMLKLFDLIQNDTDFTIKILDKIKEHHPELLKNE